MIGLTDRLQDGGVVEVAVRRQESLAHSCSRARWAQQQHSHAFILLEMAVVLCSGESMVTQKGKKGVPLRG